MSESDSDERCPDACLIKHRQREFFSARPGQRLVPDGNDRHRRERDRRQDQGIAEIERRRCDHDRRQGYEREGIGDAAGEKQKRRELKDVEGQIDRRLAIGQPVAGRVAQRQAHVQHGTGTDDCGALDERQCGTETEKDEEERRRLSANRHPAQVRQGAQAYPAPRGRCRCAGENPRLDCA